MSNLTVSSATLPLVSSAAFCQLGCIVGLAVTCQLTLSSSVIVSSACRLCGQFQSAWLKLVSSAVHIKCQLEHDLSA